MSRPPLSTRLRQATHELHRSAERSGIMPLLMQGRLDRHGYCGLLRNLQGLYETLEAALDQHAQSPLLAPVRMPFLYRSQALRDDLLALHGEDAGALPLAGATLAYVSRLRQVAAEDHALLAAHAYVRYLGDLSGGQLLRQVVERSLAPHGGGGTAFYRFDQGVDVARAKAELRSALDGLPIDEPTANAIIGEAKLAFARHTRLFEELAASSSRKSADSGVAGTGSPP